MPKAVRRPTWWTRAETLTWIMTRRLNPVGVGKAPPSATPWSQRDPDAKRWMRGVVEATLLRMQAARASRRLPDIAEATEALAQAELRGLSSDLSGRFRRMEIQKLWPSPYGRATSKIGGGVAPRSWNKRITEKLGRKFIRDRRDMTRDDLREWVGDVPFIDPEKWTLYVRRAMAWAVIDILLRRHRGIDGKPFLTREEGAAMLANVWSWRADGPLPPRS